VLIVPYAGHFDNVGRRVLIAWNATREAARAVSDAGRKAYEFLRECGCGWRSAHRHAARHE